jgi:hypothetical protein
VNLGYFPAGFPGGFGFISGRFGIISRRFRRQKIPQITQRVWVKNFPQITQRVWGKIFPGDYVEGLG